MPLVEVSNRTAVWHMSKTQLIQQLESKNVTYNSKESKEELRVRVLQFYPKESGKEKDIMSQYVSMNKATLVAAAATLKVTVSPTMLKGEILNAIRVHLTGPARKDAKQESKVKTEIKTEEAAASSTSSSTNDQPEDRESQMQTGLAGRRRHP